MVYYELVRAEFMLRGRMGDQDGDNLDVQAQKRLRILLQQVRTGAIHTCRVCYAEKRPSPSPARQRGRQRQQNSLETALLSGLDFTARDKLSASTIKPTRLLQ